MARRTVAAVALLASGSAGFAEMETGLPAAPPPLIRPFFIDQRLPSEIRTSLEQARQKLADSRCAEILTDYADASGARLDGKLRSTGETLPNYLGFVLFYDGAATPTCARSDVLAWTAPRSRAVHVCGAQFLKMHRAHPGFASNILIHEMLHTLGMPENPPDPRQITDRVIERCGQ
jgi:hypothetical protein